MNAFNITTLPRVAGIRVWGLGSLDFWNSKLGGEMLVRVPDHFRAPQHPNTLPIRNRYKMCTRADIPKDIFLYSGRHRRRHDGRYYSRKRLQMDDPGPTPIQPSSIQDNKRVGQLQQWRDSLLLQASFRRACRRVLGDISRCH